MNQRPASLWFLIKKHAGMILLWVILVTSLGVYGLTGLPKKYRANAELILDTRMEHPTDIKSVISGPLNTPDPTIVRGEVEIIQGRLVARQVIDKLGLMASKDLSQGSSFMNWASVWLEPTVQNLPNAEINAAIDAFLKKLTVFNDGRSFILSISYVSSDPVVAATVANTIAQIYLDDQIILKTGASERVTKLLEQQVKTMRSSLQQKENEIQDIRARYGLNGSSGGGGPTATVTEQQIVEMSQALGKLKATNATHEYLKKQGEDVLGVMVKRLQAARDEQARATASIFALERDADAMRSVYQSLLARQSEIVSQIGTVYADARVISPASPSSKAYFPNMPIFTSMILLLAIGSGLGFAYLIERRSSMNVNTLDDLRDNNLSVVESIPIISRRSLHGQRLSEFSLLNPRSVLAERVRSLHTEIAWDARRIKVIALTSALPGEGKTAVSLLLGRSVAASGLKALLIECDLRRSSVVDQIGLNGSPNGGLIAVLRGEVSLQSAVLTDDLSLLHLLPVETCVDRPQDYLASAAFANLIEDARSTYDFIILDTPPLGAVSDTLLIAAHADTTVIVARWHKTPVAAIKATVERLENRKLSVGGVILNAADLRKITPPQLYSFYESRRS